MSQKSKRPRRGGKGKSQRNGAPLPERLWSFLCCSAVVALSSSFFVYFHARSTGLLNRNTSMSSLARSHSEFCQQHPIARRVFLPNGEGNVGSSFVRIDDVRIDRARFSLYVLESDGVQADFVSNSIATLKVWFAPSPSHALTRPHSPSHVLFQDVGNNGNTVCH